MDHQSHEVGTVYAPAGVYWVQLRVLHQKGMPLFSSCLLVSFPKDFHRADTQYEASFEHRVKGRGVGQWGANFINRDLVT